MEQELYDSLVKKHGATGMVRSFWGGGEKKLQNVTAIICQGKQKELTQLCLESLLSFYPDLPVFVVNGSPEDFQSTYYLRYMSYKYENVTVWDRGGLNSHGEMMHDAMTKVSTDYVLLLDNDIIVERGGFIEGMLEQMNDCYATGTLMIVTRENEACGTPKDEADILRYAHPSCSMYNRKMYFDFPKFKNHGAPCVFNMIGAEHKGLKIGSYPIDQYVSHLSGASWCIPPTIWADDHGVKLRPFFTFIMSNQRQFEQLKHQSDHDFDIVTWGNSILKDVIIHDGKPVKNVDNHLYDLRFKVIGEYVIPLNENLVEIYFEFVRVAKQHIIDAKLPDQMEVSGLRIIKRSHWQYNDCLYNRT